MKIYCALGPLLDGPTRAGLPALEQNREAPPMAWGGGADQIPGEPAAQAVGKRVEEEADEGSSLI
jgi:hypothetical protein